jgi:hypothetical protein
VIKRLVLTLAASVLALGAQAAPLAQAQDFTACNGVWVVVDYGSLGGGVDTGCASSFGTGTAALRSAEFSPTLDNGMITALSGQPSKPDVQKAYWSYWQATRSSDGSYSGWKYSTVGANAAHPVKGNAEGWHYIALSDSASGPTVKPPINPAAAATASAHPTASTKATTKPSVSASAKATASPSASATPTAATATPTTSQTMPVNTEPTAPADPGSPLPLIITVVVLVAGGAGAGAWWLWRGRRR